MFDGNYTSNTSRMWGHALGGDVGLRDFDGAPAVEAAGPLRAAVERMRAAPEVYEAMNPANGWGDYAGAVCFLGGVFPRRGRDSV